MSILPGASGSGPRRRAQFPHLAQRGEQPRFPRRHRPVVGLDGLLQVPSRILVVAVQHLESFVELGRHLADQFGVLGKLLLPPADS